MKVNKRKINVKCVSGTPTEGSVPTVSVPHRIVSCQREVLIKVDKLKFDFFYEIPLIYTFHIFPFVFIVCSHFVPNFITVGLRNAP